MLQEPVRWTARGTIYLEACVDLPGDEREYHEGCEREAYRMELYSDIGFNAIPTHKSLCCGREGECGGPPIVQGHFHDFVMDQCQVVGTPVEGETFISPSIPPLSLKYLLYESKAMVLPLT